MSAPFSLSRVSPAVPFGIVRRVLLADDNPDQIGTTCLLLDMLQERAEPADRFEYFEAYNIAEAERILREKPVDIAVLDNDMPGKDKGLELIRKLRGVPNMPAMVLFTNGDKAKEAAEAGAKFVSKIPVDAVETLWRLIKRTGTKPEQN